MNLFDAYAKITLDTGDYERGLDQATGKSNTFFDVLKANLASQAIIGGIKKLGGAAIDLGKNVVAAFAEFEQLAGGVETLFGGAADIVGSNAQEAFKTAGLSANEYMETVTSFSASLIASLEGNTKEAAHVADRAIRDMADNANKLGTDISMIQNAYQGFAKQNYTMLDNLKLGYGGTQKEMMRLIEDASKMTDIQEKLGLTVDAGSTSFSNIVNAISVMQDKMGIAGATAEEAEKTISGSVASMKAAWENLLTAIADGEGLNLEARVGEFASSVVTVGKNLLPRVQMIVKSVANFITDSAPDMIAAGKEQLLAFLDGFAQNVGSIPERVASVVKSLTTAFSDKLPEFLGRGAEIVNKLTDGILAAVPDMISRLPQIINAILGYIADRYMSIANAGASVIRNLADGLLRGLPDMISRLPAIVDTVVTFFADNVPKFLQIGAELVSGIVNGVLKALPDFIAQLPVIITSFIETISKNLPKIVASGFEIIKTLGNGIFAALPELVFRLPEIGESIVAVFAESLVGVFDIGVSVVKSFWEGIKSMAGWLYDRVKDFFSNIVDSVKGGDAFSAQSYIATGNRAETGSIGFAESGLGISSSGIINGIASAQGSGNVNVEAVLKLPDNTELARYYLPSFIDVAKANGTPIAAPLGGYT